MRSREEMKEEFRRWLVKHVNLSPSRVLITMSRANMYSDEELELLTIEDLTQAVDRLKEEQFYNERFEKVIELLDYSQSSRVSYENGLIELKTFVAQVDFNVVRYGKECPRTGKCYACGGHRHGTLQFICENCETN